MANTVKHDRQEAIHKATELFWAKGFHATSMRNLQDCIDMRPGSIYASFGSKEGLFKQALQCYADTSLARLAACAEAAPPLTALKTFISLAVIDSRNTSASDICMLVKTIAELTEEHAELLAEAKRLLRKVEDAFASLLDQAQAAGELDRATDSRRLARFLQMQLMGLRAYARANDDSDRIQQLVDDSFACLN